MRPEIVILVEPGINATLLLVKIAHHVPLLDEFFLQRADQSLDEWLIIRTVGIGEILGDVRCLERGVEVFEVLRPVVVLPGLDGKRKPALCLRYQLGILQ